MGWDIVYKSLGHIVDIATIIVSFGPFGHLRIFSESLRLECP